MLDKNDVFKLKRKFDKQGYNDLLGPFKESNFLDQSSSNMPL